MTDLYWAAGFLEGEGSFTALKSKNAKRTSVSPWVGASQVQTEPLERLQAIFGGYIYPHGGKNNRCFVWRLNGRRGIALMFTLWSIMSPRRKQQIEEVIANWKSNLTVKEAAQIGVHKGWAVRRRKYADGSASHAEWRARISRALKGNKNRLGGKKFIESCPSPSTDL